ncbi:MAG: 8-oxoguanine deaminase [Thiotrichales bacterium]|nr:8-oxoguanine deaminase [Thiotrichales bacterium]
MDSTHRPVTWIKRPSAVYTANDLDAAGGVVVRDDRIVELVGTGKEPVTPVENVFDASGLVLLPGLINGHHHFYQTLTRACPPALNKPLFAWLKALYPVWANLTEEAVAVSTRLALAELMLSGCTTASDHHYLFSAALPRAIDVQVEAAAEMGTRVVLTRGSMSLSADDGGLPPRSVTERESTILAESERLIRRYHDAAPHAMCQIALAPCSPFSVTRELMRETARMARAHGVRLHTHLGETRDESEFCVAKFGMRPLDYLEDVDWLSGDVWLAHGIHFTQSEIERLGAAGTGICHCPSSNMVLASGICPVNDLLSAGARVGLGVDGSASNDCSNLMQEVRQALLIGRLRYGAEPVTHQSVLRLATRGSADLLGRSELGELRPGAAADVALFDLDALRFSGHGDPLAALVLCGASRVSDLMIAGVWRVRRGELLGIDLEALTHEHRRIARELADA